MTIKRLKLFLAWSDVDIIKIVRETGDRTSKAEMIKEFNWMEGVSPYEQFLRDDEINHLIVEDDYGIAFGYLSCISAKILTIYVY